MQNDDYDVNLSQLLKNAVERYRIDWTSKGFGSKRAYEIAIKAWNVLILEVNNDQNDYPTIRFDNFFSEFSASEKELGRRMVYFFRKSGQRFDKIATAPVFIEATIGECFVQVDSEPIDIYYSKFQNTTEMLLEFRHSLETGKLNRMALLIGPRDNLIERMIERDLGDYYYLNSPLIILIGDDERMPGEIISDYWQIAMKKYLESWELPDDFLGKIKNVKDCMIWFNLSVSDTVLDLCPFVLITNDDEGE